MLLDVMYAAEDDNIMIGADGSIEITGADGTTKKMEVSKGQQPEAGADLTEDAQMDEQPLDDDEN